MWANWAGTKKQTQSFKRTDWWKYFTRDLAYKWGARMVELRAWVLRIKRSVRTQYKNLTDWEINRKLSCPLSWSWLKTCLGYIDMESKS